MFFDDFGRSQLLGSVIRGRRGAQEPKKIKIAKNELKHSQTIIECHIKVFGVRTVGLGHHMSQFIFTDFQIDEMVSECPKIMKISKSSLYT